MGITQTGVPPSFFFPLTASSFFFRFLFLFLLSSFSFSFLRNAQESSVTVSLAETAAK
jgi:hypothetical protein